MREEKNEKERKEKDIFLTQEKKGDLAAASAEGGGGDGLLWLQPNKMLFIKGNVVLLCYERPK